MYKGEIKGFFAWGQNPACSGANSNKTRQALAKLDWMVTVNLFDNETASFWKGPGMNPKKVKTEVFFLPCAAFMEKEGSLSNSGRWAQWRYKAQNPPGDAKPDGDIMVELFNQIRAFYKDKKGKGVFPDPILNLKWDYLKDGKYDPHAVAKTINGYLHQGCHDSGQDLQEGRSGGRLCRAPGRRFDRLRQLDLLPELQRRRQQHGPPQQGG